jgi:hypothetical protein
MSHFAMYQLEFVSLHILKNIKYCAATHSMESEAVRPVNEWINDHAVTPKNVNVEGNGTTNWIHMSAFT